MEGLSPSTLRGLPTFKRLIDIMQRHYPGSVSRILVVNCPLLVWTAYKVVRLARAGDGGARRALLVARGARFWNLVAHAGLPARHGGARRARGSTGVLRATRLRLFVVWFSRRANRPVLCVLPSSGVSQSFYPS